ncbi:MAG: NAD-dependent epimerase/dehydratase family protein [Candidatus Riflebacteria bacterium]|nr:NAD-dependent epimerase/dehydratase family protein [Candidatus Riflebacteria bacterium]
MSNPNRPDPERAFFDGRKVVVTGGAGFLGSRIVRRLERQGAEVFAPRKAQYDLTSFESCLKLLQEHPAQIVFHAAALSGGIRVMQQRAGEIFFANAMMALGMMEASRRSGVEKFIAIGSSCAYPGELQGELEEKDLWAGPPHESVATLGVVKRMVQTMGMAYRRQWSFSSIQLILPSLYGPGDTFNFDSAHVASSLIRRCVEAQLESRTFIECWGTGQPVREFLFVEDAADGVLEAADVYNEPIPLNIGTGLRTSIRNLAETIQKLSGFAGEVRWDASKPDGQMVKVLSVKRCRHLLQWRATTPLGAGLGRTIQWYRENKAEADSRP